MNHGVLVASIFAALVSGTTLSTASTLQEVAESTYQVAVNHRPHCSAVAISDRFIATAAHCVPTDRKGLTVEMPDGFGQKETIRVSYSVKVKRIDYSTDVAILELSSERLSFPTWVDISQRYSPAWGDELTAVGYPRVEELTLTTGTFTSYAWIDRLAPLDGEFYKTTVPVTGGSSGGGLYTREWDPVEGSYDYALVGLTTATFRDVSFQSYFSTLENLGNLTKGLVDD